MKIVHILIIILLSYVSSELKSSEDDHFSINQLQDFRLCNNAKSHLRVETKCTNEGYGERKPCDERVIHIEDCKEVVIQMSNFTLESLLNKVPTIDSDIKFRRILIKLQFETMDSGMFARLGLQIDMFLLTRPWWYITKEPYEWNQDTHGNHILMIDRVQHGFEKEQRLLSNRQYRTSEGCSKTAMMVGRADVVHPGWLPILVYYTTAQGNIPNSIFGIYVSYQNEVNDSPAFITGSDCPLTNNKWECAFLKPTNCSYSKIISECHTNDCVRHIVPETVTFAALFDTATIDGKYVASNSVGHKSLLQQKNVPIPESNELQQWLKQYGNLYPEPKMKYIIPYSNTVPWNGMLANGVFPFMQFIFRRNYFYRSAIARLIHRFYKVNNVLPTDRCVAAHVRRGDRAVAFGGQKAINMTEYCYKHRVFDLGCFSTPFASVTLKHIIESAIQLVDPKVKTLFLASDDEQWMVDEKQAVSKLYPDWKIYFLEAPKPKDVDKKSEDEKYHYMRSTGGTASGTFWWATMQLARQCEGYIYSFWLYILYNKYHS